MKNRIVLVDKNKSGHTIKKVLWCIIINDQRPKLKIQINGIETEVLVKTREDITIISRKYWHLYWPFHEVNVQLLVIGILSPIQQSSRLAKCTRPEGQIGKVKPYVPNMAMTLWIHD